MSVDKVKWNAIKKYKNLLCPRKGYRRRVVTTAPRVGSNQNFYFLILLHKQNRTGTLDFACNFAMQVCWDACNTARKDFPAFGDKLFQEFRVFVIDGFDCDIDPATRHGAVSAAKILATFCSFWLHEFKLNSP